MGAPAADIRVAAMCNCDFQMGWEKPSSKNVQQWCAAFTRNDGIWPEVHASTEQAKVYNGHSSEGGKGRFQHSEFLAD